MFRIYPYNRSFSRIGYGGGTEAVRRQGGGVYFQVSRNYQVLEEILTAKKKLKKERKKNRELREYFFFH
jgi:hypothetical protein